MNPANIKFWEKFLNKRVYLQKNKLIDAIEFLSTHPETPRHICKKLARHFICDEPTEEMTAPMIKAWEETNGDPPSVYKALIRVVYEHTGREKKFLNPETWLLQCIKMSGANWPPSVDDMSYDFKTEPSEKSRQPEWLMTDMGHNLISPSQPNGWPDTEDEWLSPELLIRRLAVADRIEYPLKHIYEQIVEKNFDDPKAVLDLLRKAKDIDFYSNPRRQAGVLFSTERMLKV